MRDDDDARAVGVVRTYPVQSRLEAGHDLFVGLSTSEGPALLLGSFAARLDLGLDSPWYLAQLAAVGYVPLASVLIVCVWVAVGAQLTAVAGGRYAPYPDVSERPPAGPLRSILGQVVLIARDRRRDWADRRAAGG